MSDSDSPSNENTSEKWEWTKRLYSGKSSWQEFPEKFWLVPSSIQKSRLLVCESCRHLKGAVKLCRRCNCIMPFKVKIGHASCPVGKWPSINRPPPETD